MDGKTEIILIAPKFLTDLAEAAAKEISTLPEVKAASFEVDAFLKKPLKPRPSRFLFHWGTLMKMDTQSRYYLA